MIQLRYEQRSIWEELFAEEIEQLWEPWMRVVDELLADDELLDAVYQAQGKRHGQSGKLGRPQTPAEVALRMLILKHVRNWSYEVLEREVRANVVYRAFCRMLFGITTEWCSASHRNRVRLRPDSPMERTAEDMQRYAIKHDALRRHLVSQEEHDPPLLGLQLLTGHRSVNAIFTIREI